MCCASMQFNLRLRVEGGTYYMYKHNGCVVKITHIHVIAKLYDHNYLIELHTYIRGIHRKEFEPGPPCHCLSVHSKVV